MPSNFSHDAPSGFKHFRSLVDNDRHGNQSIGITKIPIVMCKFTSTAMTNGLIQRRKFCQCVMVNRTQPLLARDMERHCARNAFQKKTRLTDNILCYHSNLLPFQELFTKNGKYFLQQNTRGEMSMHEDSNGKLKRVTKIAPMQWLE